MSSTEKEIPELRVIISEDNHSLGAEVVGIDIPERVLNHFNSDQITKRQIDELIGLARGLLADGILSEPEILFLQRWLAANAYIVNEPTISLLNDRISEILRDGKVTADEAQDLMQALSEFAGGAPELGEPTKSSTLPICSPAPAVSFRDRSFCFTGTAKFGKRSKCEAAVIERGGLVGNVNFKLNYLVIGEYATSSWKHSNFGTKISGAIEYREKFGHPRIISEEHWTNAINAHGSTK